MAFQLLTPPPPNQRRARLNPGDSLAMDPRGESFQSLWAPGLGWRLTYQGDGNLVLYSMNGPAWATNTPGRGAGRVAMQGDGNLVVTDPGGKAVWAMDWETGGYKTPGSYFVLQDDGNAVVYGPDQSPIWSTRQSNYDRGTNLGKTLGKVAKSAGQAIGDVGHAIDKVPGLSIALDAAISVIPGGAAAKDILSTVAKAGQVVADASSVVQSAIKMLPNDVEKQAFAAATGVMSKAGVTPQQIAAVRNLVPSQAQGAFDFALSIAHGRAVATPPPGLSPAAQAGYFATHGAEHLPTPTQFHHHAPVVLSAPITGPHAATYVLASAEMNAGAQVAHAEIAAKHTLWQRVKHFFTRHW